jgi:L-ascorbate metabolism protein UlaG (beta-lactamase superfamily)
MSPYKLETFMHIQLIRNATMRITYAGHLFLADPYFAPQHSRPSLAQRSPNPLVELPLTPDEIMQDIEMIIVTHLHSDHFDPVAQQRLPKDLPLFCQPDDAETIRSKGFQDVRPVADTVTWQGITITRVAGRHGSSTDVLGDMGQVSGFVFSCDPERSLPDCQEPVLYWCGDTVWYDEPRAVIARWNPDVIITHSGGAVWRPERELIIMDIEQTLAVCQATPRAKVVAVHLETLDHCTVAREVLRERATGKGLAAQLVVLANGETWEYTP